MQEKLHKSEEECDLEVLKVTQYISSKITELRTSEDPSKVKKEKKTPQKQQENTAKQSSSESELLTETGPIELPDSKQPEEGKHLLYVIMYLHV